MNEKQISHLLGILVQHQSEFSRLSTSDGQWAIRHPKGAIALCIKAIEDRIIEFEELFESVNAVEAISVAGKFVAKEYFTVGANNGVKIVQLGESFKRNFLDKEESLVGEITLHYGKLFRKTLSNAIIENLGGENNSETSLGEMFALLKRQGNQENGSLLTNGFANIFCVRNIKGVLRMVRGYWFRGGWNIFDYPSDSGEWGEGDQIFYRHSP